MGKENSELFGERLSVKVPLKGLIDPKTGVASESIQWEFLCQNSCADVIKRKSAAIVFTLENDSSVFVVVFFFVKTYAFH